MKHLTLHVRLMKGFSQNVSKNYHQVLQVLRHKRKVFVLFPSQEIAANWDRNTVVLHFFSPVLLAQCVRFLPQSWENAICMRIELYGCSMGKNWSHTS